MPPKDKYTDPKLRDEVKEDIHKGDKGGAPGQWSARKAQMMASEYKKRGGDYNTDKSEKDESQKNLTKWGDEDWQTKEGSGDAKQDDGTEKRYLPKKAWENMSAEEAEATEKEKEKGSKAGKQHVANTAKAKQSRKEANEEQAEKAEEGEEKKSNGATKKSNGTGSAAKKEKKEKKEPTQGTRRSTRGQDKKDYSEDGPKKGTKRGADEDDEAEPEKKSTKTKASAGKGKSDGKESKGTFGSKQQSTEAPAPQGSSDRLPEKGQKVHWKSIPGWVEGEVVEIVKKTKTVDGKSVKATKDDPRVVLKSSSSGKIATHKPDAVFFD